MSEYNEQKQEILLTTFDLTEGREGGREGGGPCKGCLDMMHDGEL